MLDLDYLFGQAKPFRKPARQAFGCVDQSTLDASFFCHPGEGRDPSNFGHFLYETSKFLDLFKPASVGGGAGCRIKPGMTGGGLLTGPLRLIRPNQRK